MYEFIDAEYAAGDSAQSITRMCAWLRVSRSGYYEWLTRGESAAERRRVRLRELICELFEASDGTYGHRRIARELGRQGVAAGAELVRKLMRALLTADALRRAGAPRVTLVAPYLAYMRQDRVFRPGEPISQRVLGQRLCRAGREGIAVRDRW